MYGSARRKSAEASLREIWTKLYDEGWDGGKIERVSIKVPEKNRRHANRQTNRQRRDGERIT